MSKTRKEPSQTSAKSGHKVVTGVIVALVVLVVFVLLSAFVWPGWAKNSGTTAEGTTKEQGQEQEAEKKPTIDADPLPEDATDLLKTMPDTSLNYARKGVTESQNWVDSSPLEEYTVTYSTGKAAQDITLVVAQWTKSDDAKTRYDALISELTGEKLASGNIKVSGQVTGAYETHTDVNDEKKAVAVWQNDTVVFQASGPTDAIKEFYKEFPY